jgi:O-antigen ligase
MIFWGAIVIFEIGLGMASLLLPFYIIPFSVIATTLLFFIVIVGKKEFGYLLIIVAIFLTSTLFLDFHTNWVVFADHLPLLLLFVFFTYISWSLSRALIKGETHGEKKPIELLLFILVVWSMITLLWAPNLHHGLIQWIKLVSIFLILYLSIRIINSARALNRAIWIFIVMGLIDSLTVYFSVIFLEGRENYIGQFWGDLYVQLSFGSLFKRGGGLSGPNPTATRLNLVIFLTLGKVLVTENRRVRNLLFLFLSIMIMAHLLTLSRGGLVSLICGATFFLFFVPRLRERSRVGFKRMTEVFSSKITEEEFLGYRFEIWTDGFNLFKETPVSGLGIGGFEHHLNPVPYAHSIYLSVLFDLGIVGFSLFALMIFVVLNDSFYIVSKIKKEEPKIMTVALISGIIALLIHGLIDFTYMLPELWLLIGMLMAQGGLNNAYEDWY